MESCRLCLDTTVLTSFARLIPPDDPQSRPCFVPHIAEYAFNPPVTRGLEKKIIHRHRAQVPHGNLVGPQNVPHGALGSQQSLGGPRRARDEALRSIGAQFDDQEASSDRAGVTNKILGDMGWHHGHQACPHHQPMSRHIVQPPKYSNFSPMQRFLLEPASQHPAVFALPSSGQLSPCEGSHHPYPPPRQ
jgi:hypothetical protein